MDELPHDDRAQARYEAEVALLGSVLLDGAILEGLADTITPSDFADGRHALIWKALLAVRKSGVTPDMVTTLAELANGGVAETAGGLAHLVGMVNGTPTSLHATYYAQLVAKAGADERLLRALDAGIKLVMGPGDLSPGEKALRLARMIGQAVASTVETSDLYAGVRPYNADDLMGRDLGEIRWVVPGLLPEGLAMVVAPPKLGKSLFVLDLAAAVAGGGQALQSIAVEAGQVLYLDLEGNERRLQRRLRAIVGDAPIGAMTVSHVWRRLDEGGLESLATWLANHDQARLVVVDTLECVRAGEAGRSSVYRADYSALAGLQPLARQHHVLIVVVHHTNKNDGDDPFQAVNGSNGLSAPLDTLLRLRRQRGSREGALQVSGRDLDADLNLAMRFEGGRWTITGEAPAQLVVLSPERQAILDVLASASEPLGPAEIAARTGRGDQITRRILWAMSNEGVVTRPQYGKYVLSEKFAATEGNTPNTANTANTANTWNT